MAADIPNEVPREVRAGDTLSWRRQLPDYLATDGWSLSYTRVSATSAGTFAAAAEGDNFQITVPAETSAAWPAGTYTFVEFVTRSGERHTLAEYRVTVLPNLAAATGGMDTRSHAQKVLDNINAWMESKSLTAGEMQLGDRRIRNYTLTELLALRDRYAAMVSAEGSGSGLARRVLVSL